MGGGNGTSSSSSGGGPGASGSSSGPGASGSSSGPGASGSSGGPGASGSSSGPGASGSSSGPGASGSSSGSGASGSSSGPGASGSSSGSSGGGNGPSVVGNCEPSDVTSLCVPPEPADPSDCAQIAATKTVTTAPNDYNTPPGTAGSSSNTLVPETAAGEWQSDTTAIQTALGTGPKCVELTPGGANNAFLVGTIHLGSGQWLKIDQGVTVYASRNIQAYGSGCVPITFSGGSASANPGADGMCGGLFVVSGDHAGISGPGSVDGQGGEAILGVTGGSLPTGVSSWWDISDQLRPVGAAANPVLIRVLNASNFVLHKIHLYNSPRYHVTVNSDKFVIWGVDIRTPTNSKNSAGTILTNYIARNTDGIDPGGADGITQDGYVVYNTVSTGDDMVAIKGDAMGGANNVVVAHNHFGTGHGMSIGSSTIVGVQNIHVYDLTMLGTLYVDPQTPTSDLNGVRIKSYAGNGGFVKNVRYENVCINGLPHPIFVTAAYTGNTTMYTGVGADGGVVQPQLPLFTQISINDFHAINTTTLHSSSSPTNVYLAGSVSPGPPADMSFDAVEIDPVQTVTVTDATVTVGADGTNVAIPGSTAKTVTFAKDPCADALFWPSVPAVQ
jgi:polygalacturonase